MAKLESSSCFCNLDRDGLKSLWSVAVTREFAPGAEIFREGDPGDGMYFIEQGEIEISASVSTDRRQVISTAGPGDIFGEIAVVDDRPRSAGAVARAATTALFFPRAAVLGLTERSPALALALLREISGRLRHFNQQYLREVVQAERLAIVGRFARSIIHDLKNPLNIIGLKAEIAGLASTTPEVRGNYLTDIRVQVDRINDMVGEILQFTQGPQATLVLSPLDYADFVRHVADSIRAEAALRGVQLELCEPIPDVKLLVHPKRLSRVFENLVRNSIEAMPDGGNVMVRVSIAEKEVVTEVEDTGPGIAPQIADQLFQPFATFGKEHGTGLGLSICRRILEDHQGWIRARPEPGRGALLIFGLPLIPPANTQPA